MGEINMATTEQPTSPRVSQSTASRSNEDQRPGIGDRVRQGINSQVGAQKDRAVDSLMGVADAVRRMGEPLQGQPYEPFAKYVQNAAERVEQAALYLRQHEVEELVDDLRDVARRQPAVFVGVGFLAGAICGRFLKSSNRESSSYERPAGQPRRSIRSRA
jgi:hypothetical protein